MRPAADVTVNPVRLLHAHDQRRIPSSAPIRHRRRRPALAQLEQQVVQRDADRAGLPAGAAQRGGLGQLPGRVVVGVQQRRQHRADRPCVHRAVRVAADLPVDGQTFRQAPQRMQWSASWNFGAEDLRPPVVEHHHVYLADRRRRPAGAGR